MGCRNRCVRIVLQLNRVTRGGGEGLFDWGIRMGMKGPGRFQWAGSGWAVEGWFNQNFITWCKSGQIFTSVVFLPPLRKKSLISEVSVSPHFRTLADQLRTGRILHFFKSFYLRHVTRTANASFSSLLYLPAWVRRRLHICRWKGSTSSFLVDCLSLYSSTWDMHTGYR